MKDFLQPSEDEAKEYLPRYRLLYIAIIVFTVIVSTRLWYLQILQGSGLGVLLADQVLKAEMDGEAREARHRLQRRWLIRGQRQSGVGEKVVREEIVEGR